MSGRAARSSRYTARYWPTAEQRWLLRASLLSGPAALDAWASWKDGVVVDDLDMGQQRLLPLLAHNLRTHGIADTELGRFKGVLRYVWAENQRRQMQMVPLLRALHEAHVPVMLLKGMALAHHYYDNVGLRHMADIDILVRRADAPRVIDLLAGQGWQSERADRDFDVRHSLALTNAQGLEIDLHWYAIREFSGTGSDDGLWQRSEVVTQAGVPVRILSPADLMLHVMVHGLRWNAVPTLRWVADTMTILAHPHRSVDWAVVTDEARRLELVLPVRHALHYLVEHLEAAVPADVLRTLDGYRPTRFERIEQRMRDLTSPSVGGFPLELCLYRRLHRDRGPLAVVSGLPRYLQQRYDLPSLRALPGALWMRAVRRLRTAPQRA